MIYRIEDFDGSFAAYEEIVALHNLIWPEDLDSAENWQRQDQLRNPEHVKKRYVVKLEDGQIIGEGAFLHTIWHFHPHKFFVGMMVDPLYQGRGIGKALYQHIIKALAAYNPLTIESDAHSNQTRALRFLEDRDFQLVMREYNSKLDLNTFEPARFSAELQRLATTRITLTSLQELRETDPNFERKLYDIACAIMVDVPSHDEFTPHSFEMWQKSFHAEPNRIEPGCIVALDQDEYVGLSTLKRLDATDEQIQTGLTGVVRSHRRKGIALAMKVQALTYVKEQCRTAKGHAPTLYTTNEENNPMFTINEKLGFVRIPDWLSYAKVWGDLERCLG